MPILFSDEVIFDVFVHQVKSFAHSPSLYLLYTCLIITESLILEYSKERNGTLRKTYIQSSS